MVFAPLCLDPLMARICEGCGFQAGYLSGGALGYAYAVSEALLTLSEIADAARRIVLRSTLPLVVDGGVGFGDPVHTARTVWELEATGAAAIEIEDQVAPKRVSHHRGVEHLVRKEEMVSKIEHAVAARSDPDFLVIARTGAVRNEGFEASIERCKAYARAGADMLMLMPQEEEHWRLAPQVLDVPLATIAALDARSAGEWTNLGWSLVVDPFTAQVLAVDAVRSAYGKFMREGSTGAEVGDLLDSYRQLPGMAGLEALFEIERQTTERS
jgi:methylisocitrate lyase